MNNNTDILRNIELKITLPKRKMNKLENNFISYQFDQC